MIVQLVQSILDVPEYTNEGMSQLAALFKAGQDSNDILPLLNSNCDDIIATGAWIAGELEKPLPLALTCKLVELLTHSSSVVSYQARLALDSNNKQVDLISAKVFDDAELESTYDRTTSQIHNHPIAV